MIILKLKEQRIKKGITQLELAKMIETRQEIVSKWETGSRVPSLEKAAEIAAALELTLDELVEYQEIQGKISAEYEKISEED